MVQQQCPPEYDAKAWVSGSVKRPSLKPCFDVGLELDKKGEHYYVTHVGGLAKKFTEVRVGDRLLKLQERNPTEYSWQEIQEMLQSELRISFETLHPAYLKGENSTIEDTCSPSRGSTTPPIRKKTTKNKDVNLSIRRPADPRQQQRRTSPPKKKEHYNKTMTSPCTKQSHNDAEPRQQNYRPQQHSFQKPQRNNDIMNKPTQYRCYPQDRPQTHHQNTTAKSNNPACSPPPGCNLKAWVSGSLSRPNCVEKRFDFGLDFEKSKMDGQYYVTRVQGLSKAFNDVRVGDRLYKFQGYPASHFSSLKEIQHILKTELHVTFEMLHPELLDESTTEIDFGIEAGDVVPLTDMGEQHQDPTLNGKHVQVLQEAKQGQWLVQVLETGNKILVHSSNLH